MSLEPSKAPELIREFLEVAELQRHPLILQPATRELFERARAFLHEKDRWKRSKRYILYDFDEDELATIRLYKDYEEARGDADQLDNVMVLSLEFEGDRDALECIGLEECVKSGRHLSNCDDDDCCNFCGFQKGEDE